MKFISWVIALEAARREEHWRRCLPSAAERSAAWAGVAKHLFPAAGVDIRVAALVGMAAIFAGASRAMLASVVFAFETTLQPLGLLPLLGGCTAAFFASALLMRNTIMTEKLPAGASAFPRNTRPIFSMEFS